MAEAVISLVYETLQKQVGSLITDVFGEKHLYGPWTFIGKHYNYERGQSTTEQHQEHLRRRLIQKIIDQSGDHDDEEAARWSDNFFVSYGPVFIGFESVVWKRAKEEAWEYVLVSSLSDAPASDDETADTIRRRYIEEMRLVEEVSRSLYSDQDCSTTNSIASLPSDDFIWTMILDGCLLLQVVLLVLGGSKQLAYPAQNGRRRFGCPGNKDFVKAAISSMFIVGNQLPMIVLQKLMQQSFFKKIVEQGKWQQPSDLERWVLFEFLLVPVLDVKRGDTFIPTSSLPRLWYLKKFSFPSLVFPVFVIGSPIVDTIVKMIIKFSVYSFFALDVYFKKKKSNPAVVETQDLFHGLWLLMSGLTFHCEKDDDQIIGNGSENLIEDDSIDHFYDVIHPTVRSASELKEAGITFMNIEGTRIKGIRFEKTMFSTILRLPRIVIGSESEVFSNLIQYEVRHELDENRRNICAYFQLMRELIRSTDDAKLLASSGIIVLDPNQEEELPNLLQRLPIPRATTGRSLGKVRDQLTTYTRPSTFKKIGDLLSFVALLTLIQTVYAIISYHVNK